MKAEPCATLYGGSLRFNTPLVFTLGFLMLFTLGGVTGVILSNASLDIALHDKIVIIAKDGMLLPFSSAIQFNSEYIKQFWVGLMDGDGSIQVNHWRKKTLQYRMVIKLKNLPGNVNMLNLIGRTIGGYVSFVLSKDRAGSKSAREDKNRNLNINLCPYVIWKTDNKKIILSLLTILEKYPPLTTRLNCQLIFLKECLSHSSVERYLLTRNGKYLSQADLLQKFNSNFNIPNYFNGWISGFVEGQGTFALRTTASPSFAIGLNNDQYLLKAINQKFEGLNKIINKFKVFWILEIYRKSVLINIITHFEKYPLLGHKKISYDKWVTVIYKRKLQSINNF